MGKVPPDYALLIEIEPGVHTADDCLGLDQINSISLELQWGFIPFPEKKICHVINSDWIEHFPQELHHLFQELHNAVKQFTKECKTASFLRASTSVSRRRRSKIP